MRFESFFVSFYAPGYNGFLLQNNGNRNAMLPSENGLGKRKPRYEEFRKEAVQGQAWPECGSIAIGWAGRTSLLGREI